MKARTSLWVLGLLILPSLAGAFNIQMGSSVVRPGGRPLYLKIHGSVEAPIESVIRDASGHKVGALRQVSQETLAWDGRDASGKPVQPGSYFVEVESGSYLWSSVVSVDR